MQMTQHFLNDQKSIKGVTNENIVSHVHMEKVKLLSNHGIKNSYQRIT